MINKNIKGITLISLVITIVIMLILVSVTIKLTVGQNGLFVKAKTSSEEYKKNSIKEELENVISDIMIDNIENNSEEVTIDKLVGPEGLISKKVSIDSWIGSTIGIYKGYHFRVNSDMSISMTEYSKEFDSVDDMKNGYESLKQGDYVATKAYYKNGNEGGSGSYRIVEGDSSYVDDAVLKIKLNDNSSLWAILDTSNNTINICQFGAYGDGVTDDTEYVRKAVNSGIENVYVSIGKYLITSEIAINSNTKIIGSNNGNKESLFIAGKDYTPGTCIFVSGNADKQYAQNNILLEKISISGNSSVNVRGDKYSGNDGIHLIDLWSDTNVKINNCRFEDNIYAAIRLIGASNITITNNKFTSVDCGVIALGGQGIDDLLIDNNEFNGHDYSEPVSLFTDGCTYNNITITNNKMLNKVHGNAILFKEGNTFNNVIIENNYIDKCAVGINVYGIEGTNSKVINNTIVETVNGNGASFINCKDLLVDQLFISNSQLDGIEIENCKNCKFTNVTLNEFSFANHDFGGIRLTGDGTGTSVQIKVTCTDKSLGMPMLIDGQNYDFSNVTFDVQKNERMIRIYDSASGNVCHTNNALTFQDLAGGNIKNDIVINNVVNNIERGTDLNEYFYGFSTKYIVKRTYNSDVALNQMFACKNGFERTLVINASVDTILSSGDGNKGSIIYLNNRTINAGDTETIYLVCQNGVWHEVENF